MFKKNKVIKILTVPETGYMWRDGTYLQILGFLTFLYLAVQNVKKRFTLNVEQLRKVTKKIMSFIMMLSSLIMKETLKMKWIGFRVTINYL